MGRTHWLLKKDTIHEMEDDEKESLKNELNKIKEEKY